MNKPIINCHTHIFTGDCVPPLLARTLVPAPFYWLLPLTPLVKLVRWWFKSKYSPFQWRFQPWYKKLVRGLYRVKMSITRYWVLTLLKAVIGLVILFSIFHSLYAPFIRSWLAGQGVPVKIPDNLDSWLVRNGILVITDSFWLKALLLIILLLFFPSGRNLLWFVLRMFSRFFKMLPGKTTTDLLKRYINIIRFARYTRQSDILTKLTNQYPPGSSMVVLPMDMEFMGAGRQPKPYHTQMEELAELKTKRPGKIHPFGCVDPRRKESGGKVFLDYVISENSVTLGDCFIKEYIEDKEFSGFKIYPALGYFPFDEALLPLWKYAADNGIPIMTHCIRGVIYYRGPKKKEWDFHPVFEQAMGTGVDPKAADTRMNEEENEQEGYEPLLLPQMKAVDVQEIFTHPLNYACLLKKEWLAVLVGKAKDPRIKVLFGYDEQKKTIRHGLDHLKICFGHFGGEDEWAKFFEKDRDNYASQLVKFPTKGINFLGDGSIIKRGKPEQIWRSADWYSIICSLMLQHEQVYADISYILHGDLQILPLLKHTMQNDKLKTRVLYGSDFYVVRNHKSDKNMLADMMGGLSAAEFEQVAHTNPLSYLARGPVATI